MKNRVVITAGWIERSGDERNRRARWTERAERRRPSERLAAPPRKPCDVTGSPLFFAIPRRAPCARKVLIPPRGSLLSICDALLLSEVPEHGGTYFSMIAHAFIDLTFPPSKFFAFAHGRTVPDKPVIVSGSGFGQLEAISNSRFVSEKKKKRIRLLTFHSQPCT